MQERQHLLVAAHQGVLRQFNGRRIVLPIGKPAAERSLQIGVRQSNDTRQGWFKPVEAIEQRRCRPCFHNTDRLNLQGIGGAQKPHSLNGIAAGRQQFMAVAWVRRDLQLVLDQGLVALTTGTQAEAMFPQRDRRPVAVGEAVGQLSAHEGSVGTEPKSVVVK